jgi:hypothetical protein
MNIAWDDLSVVTVMSLALVLSLACHNDPRIVESLIKVSGRRLTMAAQLLLIFRIVQAVVEYGSAEMSKPILFVLWLWALGSIMGSLDKIARRWGRDISELLKPSVKYDRRRHPR